MQKELTSICFETCFKPKKFTVDYACVEPCYTKYLYAINHIRDVLIEDGREVHSDFVAQAVGKAKRDRFVEEIFPTGGHLQQ